MICNALSILELIEGDELLSRSAAMYQLTSPVDRNRKSVARFIWNDGKLHSPDRDYLQYVDDHITLGGDMERSVVHILFERLFTWASQPLSKVRSIHSLFPAK